MPRSDGSRNADAWPTTLSSASPAPSHPRPRPPRIAASIAADRLPGTPDAPRRPTPFGLAPRTAASATGSVVSLQRFFQNLLVQLQVSHDLFQPAILLLQFFQPLHLIAFHPPVLALPPVIRRLADLQFLAHRFHRRARRQLRFRFTQLANDLLGTVTLPSHRESPWPIPAD